jgi:hypothetical protein
MQPTLALREIMVGAEMRTRCRAFMLLFGLLLVPQATAAQLTGLYADPPRSRPRAAPVTVPPLLLFPLGLHVGTTGSSAQLMEGGNFTVGGELSAVYYDWLRWSWLGGFVSADALLQSSGVKVAFGPELGFWPFGLDAGPVWMNAQGVGGWGVQGRFHLTGLVSSLYVGVAALGSRATVTERWEPLIEFGLLLKFPVFLWGQLPRLPRPRERGTLLFLED